MSEDTSSSVFSSSSERKELSFDKFLSKAPRDSFDGAAVPVLGGIPLLRKLGEGGMGAVYYGVHPRLKTEVAVKVLSISGGAPDSERVQRFLREAHLCARIKSPHLVGVSDVNEEFGLQYLIMEFVNGPSAGAHLREVRSGGGQWLELNAALEICIAAAKGLATAHAEGIIHRDIKPDNILIPRGKDGSLRFEAAKLGDLGLAHVDEGAESLTRRGAVFGTPGFLAPEQSADSGTAGKPSDVFSLGATLYTLLAGRPPFSGDSAIEVILATRRKPHVPIREVRSEVPENVSAVIDRCLAKEPERRFQDGAVLLAALEKCRQTPIRRSAQAIEVSSTQVTVARNPTGASWAKRIAVALIVLVLAGAAIAAYRPAFKAVQNVPDATSTEIRTSVAVAPPTELKLDLGGGIKLDFVLVPAGSFETSRKITFPDFYIGKYPVTVAQFRQFALDKHYTTEAEREGDGKQLVRQNWEDVPGASWKNPGFKQEDDHPVVMVTLADAEAFAQWVTQRTGHEVLVCNEVEWEYAARGSEVQGYPWGKVWDGSKANHADKHLKQSGNAPRDVECSNDDDGYAYTSPVGHFNNKSWCGAFDLAGNVSQWCEHPYNTTKNNPQRGWMRGGSWAASPENCQASSHQKLDEHLRCSYCGFRVVIQRKNSEGRL